MTSQTTTHKQTISLDQATLLIPTDSKQLIFTTCTNTEKAVNMLHVLEENIFSPQMDTLTAKYWSGQAVTMHLLLPEIITIKSWQ